MSASRDDVPHRGGEIVTLHTTGEDDDGWRTSASILFRGDPVGTVEYGLYGGVLNVFFIKMADPGRLDLYARTVDALAALLSHDELYCHYVHGGIEDPREVLAYQGTSLALGAKVVGGLDGMITYGEPLLACSADALKTARSDRTLVTIMYEPPPPGEPIRPDELRDGLTAPDAHDRMDTLRRVTYSELIPDALRHEVYYFYTLDPWAEVRRFAALAMAGAFPTLPHVARVEDLLDHLVHPLQSIDTLGFEPLAPPDQAYDASHAARNKRYALLWTLGLLSTQVREQAIDVLFPRLEAEVAAHTRARELALLGVGRRELRPGGLREGIGLEPIAGLFELLRYVILRSQLVAATADAKVDRFYWLTEMVHSIVPPDGTDVMQRPLDTAVVAALYAPAPEPIEPGGTLPPELHWISY